MGYKVLHLGAADEPVLKWAANLGLPYFESVRHMLGCELLIHTDTGLGWIASGYKFKQIGLYSNADFKEFTKNIQPKNPNSVYLDASSVNDIPIDSIIKTVETMVG
jgi:ADP-heptose:LPS heptosyltransferase